LHRKSDSNWVKLNVGGQIFRTTKTTLCIDPNSMLARLFNSGLPSETDEEGAILIDRDPLFFAPLLNYMRSGKIFINPNVSVQGVLEEAKFFNIQGAIDLLYRMIETQTIVKYVTVTFDASSDYVTIEGPVEYSIMVELNGGTPPPVTLRKKLLPKVFGVGENWNLAIPLPTIFNTLARSGYRMTTASGSASAYVNPSTNQPSEHRHHIYVFVSGLTDAITLSDSRSPRSN